MSTNPAIEAQVREAQARGDLDRATELALRAYGPELIGWLVSILPEQDAYDAFSLCSEELWRSLERYDGRCSLRTWCYMLARQAAGRVRAEPQHTREQLVSSVPSVADTVAQLWNTTQVKEQREQDVYARIRAQLAEEDQVLLVLRVDRDLPWRDIAIVLLGDAAGDDELTRKAAALRKQFERVKEQLRELAARETQET